MGKKKKKHIQNEKERLHQEEAARKRAEKAEAARKDRRKNIIFFLVAALAVFAASVVIMGVHVARMRNFELNYTKMYGTITDYVRHHHTSSKRGSSISYTLVISYTFEGETYSFHDIVSYHAEPTDLIGHKTEIYVNPTNPARAVKANTADDLAIAGVFVFAFSLPFYVIGMGLYSQERGFGFAKRMLCMWLTVFALSVLGVMLCWLGFPHTDFATAYLRTDAAIGYTVLAGLALIGLAIDGAITKRH